ncbi:MAG: diaminopimelate decarboxylase, partial [Candidatus Omnitrophota bacterium]
MHYFSYKRNILYCEHVRVEGLAERFGTPLYIYSAKTILDHFFKIKKAFSSISPLICYSVKANSNLSILKLLVKNGTG